MFIEGAIIDACCSELPSCNEFKSVVSLTLGLAVTLAADSVAQNVVSVQQSAPARVWLLKENLSMKRVLSTGLALVMLLSLGALAMLARGGGAILSPAAPAAVGPKYNAIALPIDGGYDLASELVAHIQASTGNTVYQLLKWDPNQGAEGAFDVYEPGSPVSDDFDLFVGDALFALLSGTGNVLSLVGDVPSEKSISFHLVGDPAGCHYNFISVPLDMDGITKAAALANNIGDVAQVLSWDPALGEEGDYVVYDPGNPDSVDFDVKAGYPYLVCVSVSKTWPVWP